MGIEATGKLHSFGETQQISDRFSKREFVIETTDNPKYPQLVQFQLTGDRCSQLDEFSVGETVRIEFSLRGREWRSPKGEIKYFNTLDVWKLERVGERKAKEPEPQTRMTTTSGANDDIPFASCSLEHEPSPIAAVLRGGV